MDAFWDRLTATPLRLDQTDTRLEFDRQEVGRFYLPLAQALLPLAAQRRCLAAVAGPPAAGKSVFAAILAAVANALAGREIALVVGLDGWHYPNAYLDSHSVRRAGQWTALRSLKGAPETFDAQSALDVLSAIRADAPDQPVRFPIYSRALHDPLPDAGVVTPPHRLVFLEGNYWLLDQPPWSAARAAFDRTIFLTADPQALLAGLSQRLIRGGRSPEDAEAHMQAVDVPNMRLVLEHSLPADWIVRKADSRRILDIQPPL